MHPFSTPWKHQKTLGFRMFSRGRERVHWEQIVKSACNLNSSENVSWLLVLHFILTAGSLDLFVNGNVEASKTMSYVKHVSYVTISICC